MPDRFAALKAELDRLAAGGAPVANVDLVTLALAHEDADAALEELCRYADERGIEPSGERYE